MKFRLSCAAFAMAAIVSGPASAADLGGNCCADLEERIAELEATTARKGNRKVSLTVSGHVNQALFAWDDGAESNAYVITNDSGRSRVRFIGDGKINGDWKAGYYLELGFRAPRGDRVDQLTDDPGDVIDIRQSNWYIKSKTYGEIRVGFGNGASESITEINLTQTKDIAKNADVEDYAAGFQLRRKGTTGSTETFAAGLSASSWSRLVKDDFVQPGEGSRGNYILYTSPTLAGFTVSGAWGEDDFWDVALRYAGEFGGFKIAAGVAYGANTDSTGPSLQCIVNNPGAASNGNSNAECHQVGGSVSILHHDTGLFVTAAAGQFVDELVSDTAVSGLPANADDESTFYSFQTGIERKWFHLGKTTIYGEYFKHDGGANDSTFADDDAVNPFATAAGGATAKIWDSEVEVIGGGVVQGVESAAMDLYLTYRHFEADATFRNGAGELRKGQFEDLDTFMAGALIKF
jgi:predicted porin